MDSSENPEVPPNTENTGTGNHEYCTLADLCLYPPLGQPFDGEPDNHSLYTLEATRPNGILHPDEIASNTAGTGLDLVLAYLAEMPQTIDPPMVDQPQGYGNDSWSDACTAPTVTSQNGLTTCSSSLEPQSASASTSYPDSALKTDKERPAAGKGLGRTARFTCATCATGCKPVQRRCHDSLIHEPLEKEYFEAMTSLSEFRKVRRAGRRSLHQPSDWLRGIHMANFLGTAGANQAQISVFLAFRNRMRRNYYAHSKWCGACQHDGDRPKVPLPPDQVLSKDTFQKIVEDYDAIEKHFEKVQDIILKLTNQRST